MFLVQHNKRDPQLFDVYRVNVKTGDSELVAQNPGNITGWITDHAGHVPYGLGHQMVVNTSLLYRATEKDAFKIILLTTDFRTSVSPLFFTFDNKSLYALSKPWPGQDCAGAAGIRTNATESQPLFEHHEVDLGGVSYSRKRKLLTTGKFHHLEEPASFL